jgi:hypothetical protein
MFMANEPAMTPIDGIEGKIHLVRGQRVMLDSDLAAIYGVATKQLNQQLRRNQSRFPADFAFQLTNQELAHLRSQFVTSKPGRGGRRYTPWVFTEHGALMLASVLNSPRAVAMSVLVVRAFVRMRELLTQNRQLAAKLADLEARVGDHDEAIATLFETIKRLLESPSPAARREIGFHVREQATRYRTRNGI